jgi:hypothetical protein
MAWTGYDVATLVVTALTPITVVGLGVFVARAGRRLERVQWANQTVITRRLDIFGSMDDIQAAHDRLGERFRADLYVTHDRALLTSQP